MTNRDLAIAYVREYGFIVPARMGGHSYGGGFFGSEISRICRSLRKEGKFVSERIGKFERFKFKPMIVLPPAFKEKKVESEKQPSLL